MTVLRRAVLLLDLLGLVGCAVVAGVSLADDTSSTASIGVAVAVVLALPLLLSAGLALVAARLEGAGATLLTILATIVLAVLLGLVGLQLALGS